ncbi:LLM class F420-dependent oxidoreductase [Nakamurella sp. YIM 132087]|uniref:LLM class F420-dependent oxidoreductase n=1 Tax=Nakamurella alba TaxID=2665158 RepID=A0A7K1FII2_9ACTN|nr:LLM class F420-dependent oxidoreductase [Nakamurella alba]MTD13935.1 LLM class F420-dependent oxidoreductase [Nakamurella alba]
MKLGIALGYATSAQELLDAVELARAADEIGYDCAWVAEAYGSDAVTVLGAIAATTTRIDIGSGVLQMPARTPAMTSMTAATLDAISGGRLRLGLGVSGPQVSEGWHGVRFDDPLGRTEEYVTLVRSALRRKRLITDGAHFTLPLPDGPGKPLALNLRPLRPDVPIYLAAIGPRNLALLGRIADGWLGIFVDPDRPEDHIDVIRGAAAEAGRDPAAIDITAQVTVSVHEDPQVAAEALRPQAALYIGGMGSKKVNFYHRAATAMGFGAEADEVQRLYLSRDYAGAAATVPFEFLDATGLVGTPERIAGRLGAYAHAGITSVNLGVPPGPLHHRVAVLRTVHEAAAAAGVLD